MAKTSKYAHVVPGLPKLPLEQNPDRLDLMNRIRDEIYATPLDDESDWNHSAQVMSKLRELNNMVADLLADAKKCKTGSAADVGRGYADARLVLEAMYEWCSSAQLLSDAYEGMWLTRVQDEGATSMRLSTGQSISYTEEPYGKVVDKQAFRQWCVANGYEEQLQLWPSTMSTIAKERTLAGEAPPDGVEVYAMTKVRFLRG